MTPGNNATQPGEPMKPALDRNGREVRRGDTVRGPENKYRLHVQAVRDNVLLLESGREVWANEATVEKPGPLVKDADGLELRVGDDFDMGWVITDFEGDDLVEATNSFGTVRMVPAANIKRFYPRATPPSPPPPADAPTCQQTRAMGIPEAANLPAATFNGAPFPIHRNGPGQYAGGWTDNYPVVGAKDTRVADVKVKLSAGDTSAISVFPVRQDGPEAEFMAHCGKTAADRFGESILSQAGKADADPGVVAAACRLLARQRIRERYATCDWDDPVRIADAESYVVGQLGLVLRVEKDFATVAELGPAFRATQKDRDGGVYDYIKSLEGRAGKSIQFSDNGMTGSFAVYLNGKKIGRCL